MIQIIPDQVVTGVVSGAALSGTEPLASLMGLPRIGDTSSGSALVRFLGGTHGSILDPTADLAVTTEIQTQVATLKDHLMIRVALTAEIGQSGSY